MSQPVPYVDLGYIPVNAPEAKLPYAEYMNLRADIRRLHAEKYAPSQPAQASAAPRRVNTSPQKPHENPMMVAAKKLNAKFEVPNVR